MKKKSSKHSIHDLFFKEVYSNKRYSLDIFVLILTPSEFSLFDWETLKSEMTSFIDHDQKEKRMDLVFSVKLKRSKKTAKILFLLEHKSHQKNDLMVQMLEYQTGIYQKSKTPVIPILIYHGREKKWKGSLKFQDSLENITPSIRRKFGKNILDFTCRFLNIAELNISAKTNKLVSAPVLLVLQQIWKLNERTVARFFILSNNLSLKDRTDLTMKAVNYVRKNDPSFTWKRFVEIEKNTIKNEEDRVMFSLEDTLEEVREEEREEGRKRLALMMLKDYFNVEIIIKYTGFLEKELQALAKKHGLKLKYSE